MMTQSPFDFHKINQWLKLVLLTSFGEAIDLEFIERMKGFVF